MENVVHCSPRRRRRGRIEAGGEAPTGGRDPPGSPRRRRRGRIEACRRPTPPGPGRAVPHGGDAVAELKPEKVGADAELAPPVPHGGDAVAELKLERPAQPPLAALAFPTAETPWPN